VKLTAKIKLLPNPEQHQALMATLVRANDACNFVSEGAWETKQFKQFDLHKLVYYSTKERFELSAQVVVRCIAKVVDAYRLDKNRGDARVQRVFRPTGAIAYDSRILSFKPAKKTVSIWTLGGRETIPYVGGQHHEDLLQYQNGEADLFYRKGNFYLLATCDIPDEETSEINGMLGVDLGIVDIAVDSDGERFTGADIRKYRKKRAKIRASVQAKKKAGRTGAPASQSTIKNTRRLLKRISKKEQTTSRLINHTISKRLVAKAKATGRGISLEDLTGIRQRTVPRLRKAQRSEHSSWAFHELRNFIAYKCTRSGVVLITIPPAYTSKTCSTCMHIGNRSGKKFTCTNCGTTMDSDHNGARNIAIVGAEFVTRPENSVLVCHLVN